MKIIVLHADEAKEDPVDPVLEQVAGALRRSGNTASLLAVDKDLGRTVERLSEGKPDLVFNLAESYSGRSALESSIAGLLNLLDLRYTGSSASGLMLAGDKSIAKKILNAHGIRTPAATTMFRGAIESVKALEFPVIVKPPQEDASIGITGASVVGDLPTLFAQLDAVHGEYASPILVEEFIDGREFYVGVLGNQQPETLPAMEMDFTGFPSGRPRIASWDAKWGTDGEGAGAEFAGTRSIFPDDIDEALCERLNQAALAAFQALRLRDYARVDMRVRADGEVFVLEVNPNCYLEREAEFARAAEHGGTTYERLVARIVELATARYAR